MSYIAKRKLKGPKWIGLTRAISHIITVMGCNGFEALTELQNALLDGEVTARFSSFPWPPTKDCYPVPARIELVHPSFWQGCMIFPIGDGYVVETPLLANQLPDRRAVVLDNDSLLEIWPLRTAGLKAARDDKFTESRTDRWPSASAVDIRKCLLEIYQTVKPPPNVDEVFYLLLERLSRISRTASRDTVRKILREPTFAKLRRPRGRPRAR